MARIDAAIAERAREQLGLISYEELTELGCTRSMRRRRTESGVLVQAGHRVVRLAAYPSSWEQMLLASIIDAGAGAVAATMSAAAVWQFAAVRPGAIELMVPAPRQPRPMRGIVHRVTDLAPRDCTTRGLIAVTTAARTLVDVSGRMTRSQLESVLDSAARDRLLTVDEVHEVLARVRRPGRAGIVQLEEVLGLHRSKPRADSWLERRFLDLLRAACIPVPRTQVVLQTEGGGVARVDGLYDLARLVIEVDGHRTHSTRRDRQADAEREAGLVANGLRVIRFTYEDVTEREAYVAATVACHLRQPHER